MTMLLAGDVGGTKTNLAIFDTDMGLHDPVAEATFPSLDYPSLEAIVQGFLEQIGTSVDRAAFGVAGPVLGGRVTITNLPWVVDTQSLQEALGFTAVYVLNDLASVAYAVPYLEERDLYTLKAGNPAPGGAIAVIAPGTGLGEAFLTWDRGYYVPHASEGGHTGFAPGTELEIALLQYLHPRFDHVSYERICSGMGLPNIYTFLKETGRESEPAWLAERLEKARDRTPVIADAAFHRDLPCPICRRTMEIFISILGAEAGNLALKILATGGVYLGGGIPPRILPALEEGSFLEAFSRKGRLSHVLEPVPVCVILNPKAALLGAAHYGFEA